MIWTGATVSVRWFDLYIGVYIDLKPQHLRVYIVPLPMLVVCLEWLRG